MPVQIKRGKEKGGPCLIHDIVQRVGAIDGEANEDEVGFRVRQGTEAIVFFLAGGIPQGELYRLAGGRVRRVGDVVFEYCRNIFLPAREAAVSIRFLVQDTRQNKKATRLRPRLEPWGVAYLWEIALAVADEQTCFAASTVSYNDNLLRICRGLRYVSRC